MNVRDWIDEHGVTRQIRPADVDLDYDMAIMLESQRRIIIASESMQSSALRRMWIDECRKDFRVWRDNWACVYDEGRKAVIPYISRDYQDELQAIYLGLDGWVRPDGELYFAAFKKSRKTGATVGLSMPVVWLWRFGDAPTLQTLVGLKIKALDDRSGNWGACTFAKLNAIIKWMPRWMRPSGWKDTEKLRFVSKEACIVNPENGAAVVGRSADASDKSINSNRGSRSFRVWIDEAGAYSNLLEVFKAYNEDGVPIMTSTVTTYTSQWSQYLRGELVELCDKGGSGGLVVREAHLTQHPDYDQRTEKGKTALEIKKKSMDSRTWRQEIDMDDSVNEVGKIWEPVYSPEVNELSPDAARSVAMELLDDDVVWVEAIDFGQGIAITSWVVIAVIPRRITPDGVVPSRIFVVDYCSWVRADAGTIVDEIGARGWATNRNPNGRRLTYRVCDPSGSRKGRSYENGRLRDAEQSWIDNLAVEGIITSPLPIGIYASIETVKRGLAEGRIALLPQVCRRDPNSPKLPSLKECILGYTWATQAKDDGEHTGGQPEPKKNKYANGADALQFAIWQVWAPAPVKVTKLT